MSNDYIFSWAENAEGRMVHVDDVPRGLMCNCSCPNCHEKLMARHGDVREHGFAHHSENRGANLKICYMVILYKLAEQIIQTKKRIHTPSYYGIFPEKDLIFDDVKIDGCYEREDKQPDVIATTEDGKQYLIEFTFDYKVQHKQTIDYKNLNCLEINLSGQSLESVENFLLHENTDRKWLNNQDYFDNIEPTYKNANKNISLKDEQVCEACELKYSCSGVKSINSSSPIVVENSGKRYRICKPEQYAIDIEAHHKRLKKQEQQRLLEEERRRQYELRREQERIRQQQEEEELLRERQRILQQQLEARRLAELNAPPLDSSERTCFMCQANLSWMNRTGSSFANCGCYSSMRVPKNTPPEIAKTCKGFKRKL